MQQELSDLYEFLYHVTPVFIFQIKSWSDSTLCCSVHWDLVSTLLKIIQTFIWQLWKVFSTFRWFCRFVVQSESAESAKIFRSWRFFIFLYWSPKFTTLERQITNNECLRGKATRIYQFILILVSRDPCSYFSSEKLALFNFLLFCTLESSFNSVKK